MLQLSLSLDRRAADCGGSSKSDDLSASGGLVALLRSVFHISGRDRDRVNPVGPLDDRLLLDIGLSRADLQALSL